MAEKCFGPLSEGCKQTEEISCVPLGAASGTQHSFLQRGVNEEGISLHISR